MASRAGTRIAFGIAFATLLLSAIGVPAISAWQTFQTAAPRTGALSGTIVDTLTQRPLANVIVHLRGKQRAGEITDAKGRFLFDGLPPDSKYVLTAAKFGYVDGRFGQHSQGVGEVAYPFIILKEGQWIKDLQLAMAPAGSISGIVTDDQGAPIVYAYVRVLSRVVVGDDERLVTGPFARTDDRGAYRIPYLSPGSYFVQMPSVQNSLPAVVTRLEQIPPGSSTKPTLLMSAAGGQQLVVGRYPIPPPLVANEQRVYPITFSPGAVTLAGAVPIDLQAGEERGGVNFAVTPLRGYSVAGRLEGPAGSYAGLPVRLLLPGFEDVGEGGEVATAVADNSGQFNFVNVPSGSYVAVARGLTSEYANMSWITTAPVVSDAFLPRTPGSDGGSVQATMVGTRDATVIQTRISGALEYFGRGLIEVTNADSVAPAISLEKATTISGRYAWDGGATSSRRFGEVEVQSARGAASLGVLRARTDPAVPDRFEITGLVPGKYALVASAKTIVQDRLRIRSIVCAGRDYTSSTITILLGANLTDCVVTFTDKLVSLRGSVNGLSQATMDVVVFAFPFERDQWNGSAPARFKCVAPNSDGTFTIDALTAGRYYLVAASSSRITSWVEPAFLARLAAEATDVRLSWGQDVTVPLTSTVIR